jgi:hypothetical protein
MNNTLILLIALIILLIFFLAQMPRKHHIVNRHPYRKDIIYVNNSFPIWRVPSGWARPMIPLVPSHHLLGPGGIHRL